MLKNNKINMVIALVAAIVLWAYIFDMDNQASSETYRNLPITFLNEQSLTEQGLVVLDINYSSVNITYSGQRTVLNKVKGDDFKITADLDGLKKGENTVRLNITEPDGITIDKVNLQKITVIVDEYVNDDKDIIPVITNDHNDDREPYIVQISRDTAKVEGAASLIQKVDYLAAYVDAEKVGNQMKALTVALVPVDKAGNTVEGVSLRKDRVSVSVVMLGTKTVPLEIPLKEDVEEDMEQSYTLPKTITVKGTEDALNEIKKVTCKTVDLSQIYEDTIIELEPELPEGVSLAANSLHLEMEVKVRGFESKEFTLSESDIVVEGISENLLPVVEECVIHIRLTGGSSVIKEMTPEDIILVADVEGLEAGIHKVKLDCQCKKTLKTLEYTPKEISINITEGE